MLFAKVWILSSAEELAQVILFFLKDQKDVVKVIRG